MSQTFPGTVLRSHTARGLSPVMLTSGTIVPNLKRKPTTTELILADRTTVNLRKTPENRTLTKLTGNFTLNQCREVTGVERSL